MSLESDMALLARLPLFAAMERDALRLLAFSAEMRILRAGDVLFRRGELADGGYVVAAGSLDLTDQGEAGPAFAVAGPGTLLGELALFADVERPITAIAREPSQVMRISRFLFRRMLGEFPATAARLHGNLAARLGATAQDLGRVRDALITLGIDEGEADAGPATPSDTD